MKSTGPKSQAHHKRASPALVPASKRELGGRRWLDKTMADWPENDYRIFVGNIGHEVTEEHLVVVFRRFASFMRARVVRDPRTNRGKGYGFVSFGDPEDYIKAMKEIDGKYIGKKPVKLMRSDWKKRQQNR